MEVLGMRLWRGMSTRVTFKADSGVSGDAIFQLLSVAGVGYFAKVSRGANNGQVLYAFRRSGAEAKFL